MLKACLPPLYRKHQRLSIDYSPSLLNADQGKLFGEHSISSMSSKKEKSVRDTNINLSTLRVNIFRETFSANKQREDARM